jgi:hypothetical protein
MNIDAHSVSREAHEFYIAKVNAAVAQGHESMIASLIADYMDLIREESDRVDRAA